MGIVTPILILALTAPQALANTAAPRPADAAGDVAARARMAEGTAERLSELAAAWDARSFTPGTVTPPERPLPVRQPVRVVFAGDVRPAAPAQPKPESKSKVEKPRYQGTTHFWFPALGINKNVVLFPCERKRPPDNYLYRWGCAKRNNVYLLGHAYSVLKPLHDAYVSGRLKVGMIAYYADGNGKVRKYRVKEWRVVDPAEGVQWAIAAQPVPSMTLQTCVGKNGVDRLNVRLVAVG